MTFEDSTTDATSEGGFVRCSYRAFVSYRRLVWLCIGSLYGLAAGDVDTAEAGLIDVVASLIDGETAASPWAKTTKQSSITTRTTPNRALGCVVAVAALQVQGRPPHNQARNK